MQSPFVALSWLTHITVRNSVVHELMGHLAMGALSLLMNAGDANSSRVECGSKPGRDL